MLEIAVLVALSALAEGRTVSSLFGETGKVEVAASGMTIVRAPQTHVLIARIEDGGTLTTGCAATEEAVQVLLAKETPKKK